MPLQKLTFGDHILDQHYAAKGLRVNDGTSIVKVLAGTVNVDPPSIGATSNGTVAVTINGAATTDLVFLTPPHDLEAGLVLVGARVTAANTVTIALRNTTGSAIDGASRAWSYLILGVA